VKHVDEVMMGGDEVQKKKRRWAKEMRSEHGISHPETKFAG
jgi:hypothetical protein